MKNTNDILDELQNAGSEDKLDSIIKDNSYKTYTFSEYYNNLLDSKGIPVKKVIKDSAISRTYAYQLVSGIRQPGRDNALALCIAAGLDLDETNRCLTILKLGVLYPKDKRDAVIIYAIKSGFTAEETNNLLYKKEMQEL